MTSSRIDLTRAQILAFRRHIGALDERLPSGRRSLRRAAWAGLQDSMPRAALLSIHARVEGTAPSTWADPSLAQLWGPRFSAYVVAERDFALFSLGRWPDDVKGRRVAEDVAARLHAHLGGRRMGYGQPGTARRIPTASGMPHRPARCGSGGRRPASDLTVLPPDIGRATASSSRAGIPRSVRHAGAFAPAGGDRPSASVAAFEAARSRLRCGPRSATCVGPRPRQAGAPRDAGPRPRTALPAAPYFSSRADRELLVLDAPSRCPLDLARLAGCRHGRRRDRRDVATRGCDRDGPALATALARGPGCGRDGSGVAAAARRRGEDRRSLGLTRARLLRNVRSRPRRRRSACGEGFDRVGLGPCLEDASDRQQRCDRRCARDDLIGADCGLPRNILAADDVAPAGRAEMRTTRALAAFTGLTFPPPPLPASTRSAGITVIPFFS